MADIGATLREARMRARIDINEVEIRTKIRAKYLRAIENEEWDLLPGEVYVKSFLRTYGDYLGLDSRQLIDDYKRRFERPTDHDVRPLSPRAARDRDRMRSRGPRRPRIPSWLVIGVVLIAIVVALYLVGSTSNNPPSQAQTHPKVTHRQTPVRRHRPPRVLATKVHLQLTPTGPIYVCLVDGTGRRLIPGQVFNVGQPIPAKTAPKLLLTLGNAQVTMKVNGRPVPVPATGKPVGFELTPAAHAILPAAKAPTCA